MKRKMAWTAYSFSAGILLAVVLLPRSLWLAGTMLFSAAAFLVTLMIRRPWARPVSLILLMLSAALLWTALYERLFLRPLEALDQQTLSQDAVVIEEPVETDYGAYATVRLTDLGFLGRKARLYCYGEEDAVVLTALSCGEQITAEIRLRYTLSDNYRGTTNLASHGCFLSCTAVGPIQRQGRSLLWLLYSPARFGVRLRGVIREAFPRDVAPLAQALLTGDTKDLRNDAVTADSLSKAGIYHICAVSGLHILFLSALIFRLWPGTKTAPYAVLTVIWLFTAMTGFPASAVRASILQTFLIAAPLLRRTSDDLTSLGTALLLMLLFQPWSVLNVGLELSFSASLGILLVSGKLLRYFSTHLPPGRGTTWIRRRMLRFRDALLQTLAASVGAMLFTVPLSAFWFGSFSLAAPMTNVLLFWLVSAAFYGASFAAALGILYLPFASVLCGVVAWPMRLILYTAALISRTSVSSLYVSSPYILAWVLLLYGIIVLLLLLRVRARIWIVSLTGSFGLLTALMLINTASCSRPGLQISVLDVGQGECVILRDSGYTAVIDCGSSSLFDAGERAVNYLRSQGENRIDLLLFTHFDQDHTDGAAALFSGESVSGVYIPDPTRVTGEAWKDLLTLSQSYGSEAYLVTEELTFYLGSTVVRVFPPPLPTRKNNCLCVLASCGETDVLITGDLSGEGERTLLRQRSLSGVEYLVAGHHGSDDSTTDELLDAIKPKMVLISVGENRYGHPTEAVLLRLRERSLQVRRTDLEGTITIFVNGE